MKLTNSHLAEVRGTGMNMIFQESLISLNPVYRAESQIEESLDVVNKARKILENDGEKRKKMIRVLNESMPRSARTGPEEISSRTFRWNETANRYRDVNC